MATNIKVGNTVVYDNREIELVTIERETRTLYITKENHRFKKDSLRGYGDTYGLIRPLKNDAEKAKISRDIQERRAKEARKIEHGNLSYHFAFKMKWDWEKLSLDQLRRVEAIINENC